jgi:molybdenum cofactor cytidylyltransferase
MNTSIIILAAGASSRMEMPKQLLMIEGKTLIRRVSEMAIETSCHPIVVVLGANKEPIRKEIEKIPLTIIENPKWEDGMSSSMKMGLVGAYLTEKEIDAVIFLTVDMPFVSSKLINDMIAKAIENPDSQIVACSYEKQFGIPVLFKRSLFNDLLELKGDEGAKKIVLKNKDKTSLIDFPEGKFDLDTIDEYWNFVGQLNQN